MKFRRILPLFDEPQRVAKKRLIGQVAALFLKQGLQILVQFILHHCPFIRIACNRKARLSSFPHPVKYWI